MFTAERTTWVLDGSVGFDENLEVSKDVETQKGGSSIKTLCKFKSAMFVTERKGWCYTQWQQLFIGW